MTLCIGDKEASQVLNTCAPGILLGPKRLLSAEGQSLSMATIVAGKVDTSSTVTAAHIEHPGPSPNIS